MDTFTIQGCTAAGRYCPTFTRNASQPGAAAPSHDIAFRDTRAGLEQSAAALRKQAEADAEIYRRHIMSLTRTPSPSEAQPVAWVDRFALECLRQGDDAMNVDLYPSKMYADNAPLYAHPAPSPSEAVADAVQQIRDRAEREGAPVLHGIPAPSPSEGVREALAAMLEHYDANVDSDDWVPLIAKARAALASSTVEETKRGEGRG